MRLLLALALFLVTTPAWSAPTYIYSNYKKLDNRATVEVSFTTGTQDNRILLLAVNQINSGTPASPVFSTASFVYVTAVAYDANRYGLWLWYSKNPPAGITGNITVTTGSGDHAITAVEYHGVDQTTPLADWDLSKAAVGAAANTQTLTLTATTANSMLVSFYTADGAQRSTPTASTQRVNQSWSRVQELSAPSIGDVAFTWLVHAFGYASAIDVILNPAPVVSVSAPTLLSPYLQNTLLPNLQPKRLR